MPGEIIELPVARAGERKADPDLAAAAANGDKAAFETLVRRHQGVVRGLARRLAGSPDVADDIAQVTFLNAWRSIKTYSGGAFRSWLCAIAYREFLQVTGKEKRRRDALEAVNDQEPTLASSSGARLDLDRALGALPEAQRVAIVLCVAAGMSHSEAAAATGWPVGTVKSHVLRGKARLKEALDAYAAAS